MYHPLCWYGRCSWQGNVQKKDIIRLSAEFTLQTRHAKDTSSAVVFFFMLNLSSVAHLKALPTEARCQAPASWRSVSLSSSVAASCAIENTKLREVITTMASAIWQPTDEHAARIRHVRTLMPAFVRELDSALGDSVGREGGTDTWPDQQQIYTAIATLPQLGHAPTICEIGFNAGHSALLWLLASPASRVVSFDLARHSAVDVALRWLRNHPKLNASSRLELIRGPSNDTVPRFAAKSANPRCQVLSIDGGHGRAVAQQDLINMRLLADPCRHLALIDDCSMISRHRALYTQGVVGAYRWMQSQQRVCSLLSAERRTLPPRGFTVFSYAAGASTDSTAVVTSKPQEAVEPSYIRRGTYAPFEDSLPRSLLTKLAHEAQNAADVPAALRVVTQCAEYYITPAFWSVLGQGGLPRVGSVVQSPRMASTLVARAAAMSPSSFRGGSPVICEIGFGAGHSSVLWLRSHATAQLRIFDLLALPYSRAARSLVEAAWPGRVRFYEGDSTVAVAAYAAAVGNGTEASCDLVFIDGSHTGETPRLDFANALAASSPGASLVANDVTIGWRTVKLPWDALVRTKQLVEEVCEEQTLCAKGERKRPKSGNIARGVWIRDTTPLTPCERKPASSGSASGRRKAKGCVPRNDLTTRCFKKRWCAARIPSRDGKV